MPSLQTIRARAMENRIEREMRRMVRAAEERARAARAEMAAVERLRAIRKCTMHRACRAPLVARGLAPAPWGACARGVVEREEAAVRRRTATRTAAWTPERRARASRHHTEVWRERRRRVHHAINVETTVRLVGRFA